MTTKIKTTGPTNGSCVTRRWNVRPQNDTQFWRRTMYEQTELEPLVRQLESEGKWIDCGSWRRARNGQLEYEPTESEIEAKCELLRQIEN